MAKWGKKEEKGIGVHNMLLSFLLRRFNIKTSSSTVRIHLSFQINLRSSFFFSVYWFGYCSWLLSAALQPVCCFFQAISRSGASTSQQLLSEKNNRKNLLAWVLTPAKNDYFWHRTWFHASIDIRVIFVAVPPPVLSPGLYFTYTSLKPDQNPRLTTRQRLIRTQLKWKVAHLGNVAHRKRLGEDRKSVV